MSYFSLADATANICALHEDTVKTLVLGDHESRKGRGALCGAESLIIKQILKAESPIGTSGLPDLKDRIITSTKLTDAQSPALAQSRQKVRCLISDNSSMQFEEEEDDRSQAQLLKAWELMPDPLEGFWEKHLISALVKDEIYRPQPTMDMFNHLKTVFKSFTHQDPENFEQCMHDSLRQHSTTLVLSRDSQILAFWDITESTWAETLRGELKTSLGVELGNLPHDQQVAVLKSYEGVEAAQFANSVALLRTVDFAKLAERYHKTASDGSVPPKSALRMLKAKLAEVERLRSEGTLSSYVPTL